MAQKPGGRNHNKPAATQPGWPRSRLYRRFLARRAEVAAQFHEADALLVDFVGCSHPRTAENGNRRAPALEGVQPKESANKGRNEGKPAVKGQSEDCSREPYG